MVQFSVACTEDDLQDSLQLVHEVYVKEGYRNPDDSHNEGIGAYLGRAGATTMIARHNEQLFGTISVVSDMHGVPMDIMYREELGVYRDTGARIGEVCQFAINKLALKEFPHIAVLDVSVGLLGLAVQYGLVSAHDYLCFAINPKHRVFYESLGCIRIGEEKSYDSVSGAPALGYVLSMDAVRQAKESEEKKHFLLTKIFDTELPENFFI